MNRRPEINNGKVLDAVDKISKSDWIDAYFDLYRQMGGEGASEQEILENAQRRLKILKRYRASNGRAA